MTIELFDMDVPYSLQIDCTEEGEDYVRIIPNSDDEGAIDENYHIRLDYHDCQELARVLNFLAHEIKPQKIKRKPTTKVLPGKKDIYNI